MKSKFILITAILLSILHQGFSQREIIETVIEMPAKYKKIFDEGQKLMSDLMESERLKNLQGKLILYRKQLAEKKCVLFSSGELKQTEAKERKLQNCL